jgi:hypothetical protein
VHKKSLLIVRTAYVGTLVKSNRKDIEARQTFQSEIAFIRRKYNKCD